MIMSLPIITLINSGSSPVKNFLRRLMPSKSTYTLRFTSNSCPVIICKTKTVSENQILMPNTWQQNSLMRKIDLAADEMSVFVAVDLLIILEHTVAGAGTHEVIIALTRCQAASHSGAGLVAALAAL